VCIHVLITMCFHVFITGNQAAGTLDRREAATPPGCYNNVTMLLQWCYNCVTVV
jgi:hypothetical protein